VEHQGREHACTDQREIEPLAAFCEEEGEIAEVPEDVRGADADEDNIESGPGGTKQYQGYKDKVNQGNQKGQVSIDGENRLGHIAVAYPLRFHQIKKLHFLSGIWSFILFTGHAPAFLGERSYRKRFTGLNFDLNLDEICRKVN
jgi:hypothetical protein